LTAHLNDILLPPKNNKEVSHLFLLISTLSLVTFLHLSINKCQCSCMSNALIFIQSAPSPVYATNQNGCMCLVCHTRHLLESFNVVNKSQKWMENLHVATRAKISRSQLLAPKSLLLLLLHKGLHVLQWFIYNAKSFQEHDCATNKTLATIWGATPGKGVRLCELLSQ
jgi:hypothetical protein